MAGNSTRLLSPAEVIEGDRQGTADFVFCRIGEPVPLKPAHSDSAFDLSNPPFQPLAVSERHRLLFLAHAEGFLVANTKDVIGLAKGGGGKGTCVQRSSVVDAQIGRVSILALSGDNSILAATVGGEIHLFYVQSLLDKVQEPAISCPLKDSAIVRDLKWRRCSENSFIVLSSHGLLCRGSSDLQLKDVMDNVDAVDWSVDGKFVAIARKDTVSILSSNFEEVLGIPLLFQSWDVDSGSEINVDSIKWVRQDSVVIGRTQLNEDGDEDGYLVQVIVTGEHKLTEVSCKPVVFSFPDLFEGLSVDMLPTGVGPYLLADYLDCWDVAITSNKKNIDQHISLLRWLAEDNRYEVVSLELGSDKYIPRIDLQDDGDDNLILGLAIDRSSLYEKIKIQSDMELKELSPRCILLCLTCDGKLTLHHAAWVSEPSDLPKTVFLPGDNIVNEGYHPTSSVESDLVLSASRLKDGLDPAISGIKKGSDGTLDGAEQFSQGLGMITSSYSRRPATEEPRMSSNAGDLGSKSTDNELPSDSLMVKGTGTSKIVGSAMGSTLGSQTAQKIFGVVGSNASASSTVKGTGTSGSLGSTINDGSSSMSHTVMPFAFDTVDAKDLSPGDSKSAAMGNKVLFSAPSNSPTNFAPFSKPSGTLMSSEKINQSSMQTTSTKSGYTSSPPILHGSSTPASAKLPGSRQQLPLANSTPSKSHQRLEAESQFSKQFYNVKEMAKELDALLSSIECEGGFKDLCTVFQEKSLLALEAGLDDLSELLFVYRDKIENQRMEIQQLCNKMLEVSARQVYMKGIVQQASDHRYWAFWNSQKLSPKFEAKRLHISNLKQNLTNQLIELERHFNNLEINRFGECNKPTTSWRSPCSSAPSKQTQSLHSLYSTANSQLAAAEQLSEHLSKQMAALNISSRTSEKRSVTKELFESIGLELQTDAFLSPDPKSYKLLPYPSKRSSLSPGTTSKKESWNCAPDDVKVFQLESVRRKRDSLDKNWVHFEPSRTTIKRTSKKELVRSNLDKAFREAKVAFDSQLKAFDNAPKSAGMRNVSIASSADFDSRKQAIGLANRSSKGTTSNTAFGSSQSVEQSPIKGIQEKSSKKAIDAQPKPIFKWAKDPLDQRSERHTSSTSSSTSSQMSQSSGTQPFSFATLSIFSNYSSSKDEKFDSPATSNMGASTSSQLSQSAGTQPFSFAMPSIFSNSSINKDDKFDSSNTGASFALDNSSTAVTKTTSASKPTSVPTQAKFPSSVPPSKAASTAETRSQSDQSTLSASIAQTTAYSTSSSVSSFQFGSSMQPNIFSSPSKSNAPSSLSTELIPKSMVSQARGPASDDSPLLNKIGSNNAAVNDPPKEVTTETMHLSASENVVAGNINDSKLQRSMSRIPATSNPPLPREESVPPSTSNGSMLLPPSGFLPAAGSAMAMPSSIMTTEKDESLDANLSQEDEMEEEASSALDTNSMLNLESLGGFSSQSIASSTAPKPNPFGSSFLPASSGGTSPQLSWSVSPGQLFRPPSFNLPESQSLQLSQPTGSSSLTGSLSGGFSGFGQPAQLGSGQQALGSVLGSFGQSRQLGTGLPAFGFDSAAGSSGGFSNSSGFAGGGFAGAATGGGFAGAATGGGFAGAATGGGFAGISAGGGFAGAATGGGFAGAGSDFGGVSSGGGFATGGFGGFSSFQGSGGGSGGGGGGGFSAFGSGNSSAGRPPAELLTKMRK